jgi:hypothetical protein
MFTFRRAVAATAIVGLLCASVPANAISCLLFPLSCLKPKKKYGEEMQGTVLSLSSTRTDHYTVGPEGTQFQGLETTKQYFLWFEVGHTRYQAERNETLLQMGYRPKREDWVGHTVKLRFMDEKWLGVNGAVVLFKRPDGKDWKFAVVSIIGPNGVDECKGHALCPPQAKVDREAIETAQLQAMQAAPAQPAPPAAPAPAAAPAAPVAPAPVETSAPAPAEAPVPSEAPAPQEATQQQPQV